MAPDGQTLPSHQELSLRVFAKEAGVWSVAAFHNTMVRPFGAPCLKRYPGIGIRGAARFQCTVAPASPRVIATEAGNELRRLGSRRQPKMRSNVRVGLRAADFTRAANGSLGRGFPFRGAGGKVRNRRISPSALPLGEGRVTEAIAAARRIQSVLLFVPVH